MGKIIILDENTANQIAAGEVIERPASIVKEMVENALDANATAITVDIVNGGIKSIRITDNGDGIATDDIEMAFERHATSKIRRIDDLDNLSTMGFRGEALASIASVAKVEAVTKTEEAASGLKVVVEAGNILSVEPTGAPKGTTFTVGALFFNTPARYKFLKKDATEAGYIQDMLTRIALARPDVSIKFINQGRTVMHTPGNHDLLSVIYSIYGKDIARAVLPVNATGEGLEVSGFVGKPEIARGNRSFQSILINGRFVYNKIITAALEEAYKTRLMQKRFPYAVLKLNMSPRFVDVNVHPAKLEVRFSDDQKVFRAIYHAVVDALAQISLIPRLEQNFGDIRSSGLSTATTESTPTQSTAASAGHHRELLRSSMAYVKQQDGTALSVKSQPFGEVELKGERLSSQEVDLKGERLSSQEVDLKGERLPSHEVDLKREELPYKEDNINGKKLSYKEVDINRGKLPIAEDKLREQGQHFNRNALSDIMQDINDTDATEQRKEQDFASPPSSEKMIGYRKTDASAEQMVEQQSLQHMAVTPEDDREKLLHARIIGQVFNSYILLEEGNDMLLIDQHAAHERIRYEKIKQQFITKEAFGQGLLSPLTVNLSELEMQKFYELSEYIEKLGFEAEVFGSRTILIRAIPYLLDSSFSGQDFVDILEKLSQEVPTTMEKFSVILSEKVEVPSMAKKVSDAYSEKTGVSISVNATGVHFEKDDTAISEKNMDVPSVSEMIPEETIYMMACKSAIKANRAMTAMEIKGLVEELVRTINPYTCVHGRPVIISMSQREMEKRFKRIV